jgi:hypothetical protein
MTDPTPDAIRPEWEPWVEKAAKALCEQAKPPYVGAAGACPHHRTIAEEVLAAVCGDIVEAARRDALTEAIEAVMAEIEPKHSEQLHALVGILAVLRATNAPRRPQEPPQSDVGAESTSTGEPAKPEALSGGTS